MISVKNITKKFGSLTAVDGVSFEVKKGAIVGFLGPNGAGKTTTMRMITGYFEPDAGEILVDGIDIVSDPIAAKSLLGYLPENSPMYEDMTVKEFLEFIMDIRGVEKRSQRIEYAVESAGLEPVYNRFIWELSKGFHQRVGIAQTLLSDPKFLVLDEPTSGLDPNQILDIRNLVRDLSKEKTIILSTHILQEAEALADEILIIDKAKLVATGSMEDLKGRFLSSHSTHVIARNDVKFKEEVKKIEGVVEVERTVSGDYGNYTIYSKDDIAEKVFNTAAATDAVLKELSARAASLEDVFIELTAGGKNEK